VNVASDVFMKNPFYIIYDPAYTTSYVTASVEKPERVRQIMKELGDSYPIIKPTSCTDEDILLCHSEGLLTMEKQDDVRFTVAKLAAGGAITAATMPMEGKPSFAVIRPPGHHANPDHNWGFCYFNNMGIAIKRLLADSIIQKAIILDIDLHFGDGTDTIFKSTINVPVLNIQSSNPVDFINETKTRLQQCGSADILGISAGFDQYIKDWGANLSTQDYFTIGQIAGNHARHYCKGHIFAILEGGYYIPDLGKNVIALIEGICNGLYD